MNELQTMVQESCDELLEKLKDGKSEIKVSIIVERIIPFNQEFLNDFYIVGKIHNGVITRNVTPVEMISTMMSVAHMAQPRPK